MLAVTLASLLIACAGALLATPVARLAAVRLDRQVRPHYLGTRLTGVPRLGGLAIYVALVASGLYLAGTNEWLTVGEQHQLLGLLLGGGVVLTAGVYGDLRRLEPGWRLAWGTLAAAVAMSYDARLFVSPTPAISVVLAVAVLIVTPNAMKLGDCDQRLVLGIGAIAAACLGLLSWLVGSQLGVGLAAACIGALAGFLRYHHQPARAALGDGGSALLGFILAGLTVGIISRSSAGPAWVGLMAILTIPLAEAGIGVVRRARAAAGNMERHAPLQEQHHA